MDEHEHKQHDKHTNNHSIAAPESTKQEINRL